MGSLDQSCIFDLEDSFTDEISFYENEENGELESFLVSRSKFSPAAESTKIGSALQETTTGTTHFTSRSLTCVTPLTPARVNQFIKPESSCYDTTISESKQVARNVLYVSDASVNSEGESSVESDAQCVPRVKEEILERIVEGCEAADAFVGVAAKTYTKNRQIASSTMTRKERTLKASRRISKPHGSSTASRRISKPRASSTMIEESDNDLTEEERESASIYTWSIDRSSELLFCEDSYMRKIERKLVPVFGNTAVKHSMLKKDSISSEEDTLKYEDGRTSDASSTRQKKHSIRKPYHYGLPCVLRDMDPIMSSTRRDFHEVPKSDKEDAHVRCFRERPEGVGEEESDTSRVTPDNPSAVNFSALQKPIKISKFNHMFKLRRAKAMTSLNAVIKRENSPTKRALFQAKKAKEDKKTKGVLSRIKLMKKLKRFPIHGDTQFQALAVL